MSVITVDVKKLIEEYYSSRPDCRFMLKRTGANILYCIGRNPSSGSVYNTDPTLSVIDAISAQNGFDGFAMLNLYPQRGKCEVPFQDTVIAQNALFVASQIPTGATILAAWGVKEGNNADYKKCLAKIVTQFQSLSAFKWKCLGQTDSSPPRTTDSSPPKQTKSVNPRMPYPRGFSYKDPLPDLVDFDLVAYLNKLGIIN